MLDQLKIENVSSLDFGASLAQRAIKAPAKKIIKETVPFSNVIYDFSAINGELYWEERELEYVFEIIADSPEELEEKKTAFSAWVMNVMNEHIYDPYEPNYHYIGTYSDMEYADEDCVEKTTATVKFFAYPYKVKNEETVYEVTVEGGTQTYSLIADETTILTSITGISLGAFCKFSDLIPTEEELIGATVTYTMDGEEYANVIKSILPDLETMPSETGYYICSDTLIGLDGQSYLIFYFDADIEDGGFVFHIAKSTMTDVGVNETGTYINIYFFPATITWTVGGGGGDVSVTIANNSAHRITPTVTADFELTIEKDGVSYGFPEGATVKDERFKLAVGDNEMVLKSGGGSGNTVRISFSEEVF